VTFTWYDTANSRIGGVSSVTSLEVYKKDINGEWVKVVDRKPSEGRAFGTYGTQVEIGAPADVSTQVQFNYRKNGSTGAYTEVLDAQLYKFGDSYWFDSKLLADGTYDYEFWFTKHHLVVDTDQDGVDNESGETLQSESYDVERRTESGTFTTKADDVDDAALTENIQNPTRTFLLDRWGNLLEENDPRQSTWKTVRTYNLYNQVTSEKRPDAIYGNQGGTSPYRQFFYDKLGRQVAVQDERKFVTRQEYDGAGNLVKEIHADGGVVTYLYDAFGQRRSMIDALGNASTDAEFKTDHTTKYTFDKMGRLRYTQHGTTAGGSVTKWYIETDGDISPGTGANLVETVTYDEAGRKKTQVNGAGETIKYLYDRAGNIVETRQPLGQASKVSYAVDAAAGTNTRTETDANGNFATWTYDYFGKLLDHNDLAGKDFNYAYDAAGQLTRQTSTWGQDLTYTYDGAGQLITIEDGALDQTTTYAYDLAGNRLRELVQKASGSFVNTVQDNHLAYDTLGRLIYVADGRVQMTFTYDNANNRTRVQSHVLVDIVGNANFETSFDADRYFRYDAMNRQTLVDGTASGGITTTQGHKIKYDLNGNRIEDQFYGNSVDVGTDYYYRYDRRTDSQVQYGIPTYDTKPNSLVTEIYDYDAKGRLSTVERDKVLVDRRLYDGAGRVVVSGPNGLPTGYAAALNEGVPEADQIGMEVKRNRYDTNGRLVEERTYKSDGSTRKSTVLYAGDAYDDTVLGYDNAGNVKAYQVTVHGSGGYTSRTIVETNRYEGYVEKSRSTTTKDGVLKNGSTTSSYDVNGFLIGVDDSTENTLDRTIVNDVQGRALLVTQNTNKLYSLMVNGELLGQHGIGVDDVDPRTDKNAARFEQKADFEFGYQSITGSYPSAGIGAYVVRSGDSLQSIARAAYGDSSQWWRIAQANGLQGDSGLRVGQSVTLPSLVAGGSNNAGTFNPYNQAEVVGDTSPNLPIPKFDGGRCAGLSMAIGVIVAVVVTWAISVSTWGIGAPAGAAIGAAVGDAARQYSYAAFNGQLDGGDIARVGLGRKPRHLLSPAYNLKHPIGFKDSEYDYKATAISAAAAYMGSAVGTGAAAQFGSKAVGVFAGTTASYMTTTMLNGVAGRGEDPSIKGYLASLAAAYAGSTASDAVGTAQYGEAGWAQVQADMQLHIPEANLGNQIVRGLVSGISGNVAAMLVDPKHRSAESVWANVLGSMIGEGLVSGLQSDRRYSLTGSGGRFGEGRNAADFSDAGVERGPSAMALASWSDPTTSPSEFSLSSPELRTGYPTPKAPRENATPSDYRVEVQSAKMSLAEMAWYDSTLGGRSLAHSDIVESRAPQLADSDRDWADPVELKLRPPGELRDLARAGWNSIVSGVELGIQAGRGLLRLYDRNPDGSPNINSLLKTHLDDWRLPYESKPYREEGMDVFSETLLGMGLAGAAPAMYGRARVGLRLGSVDEAGETRLAAAATKMHATEHLWRKNAAGPRGLEDAILFADENGAFGAGLIDYKMIGSNSVRVELEGGVRLRFVVVEESKFKTFSPNHEREWANYSTKPQDPIAHNRGATISSIFEDEILVRVRASTFESDRAIVGVLGHEAYEISNLFGRIRSGMLSKQLPEQLSYAHNSAVNNTDDLVRAMIERGL
jgi:YD repeat-containing protein